VPPCIPTASCLYQSFPSAFFQYSIVSWQDLVLFIPFQKQRSLCCSVRGRAYDQDFRVAAYEHQHFLHACGNCQFYFSIALPILLPYPCVAAREQSYTICLLFLNDFLVICQQTRNLLNR